MNLPRYNPTSQKCEIKNPDCLKLNCQADKMSLFLRKDVFLGLSGFTKLLSDNSSATCSADNIGKKNRSKLDNFVNIYSSLDKISKINKINNNLLILRLSDFQTQPANMRKNLMQMFSLIMFCKEPNFMTNLIIF